MGSIFSNIISEKFDTPIDFTLPLRGVKTRIEAVKTEKWGVTFLADRFHLPPRVGEVPISRDVSGTVG
jgi:hypothetical protein